MEVLLESEEQMGQNKQKRSAKRPRPNGPQAPSPAAVADQTGRLLAEREHEWLERLTTDPASFASVELRFTSKPAGRPISTSPDCWPRPVSNPRRFRTSTK